MDSVASYPVLSTDEARSLENSLFCNDPVAESRAMKRAGVSVARAILMDSLEIGGLRPAARILVLAGKGNNAGDALIATEHLLDSVPLSEADVVMVFGSRGLRDAAAAAWKHLVERHRGRVRQVEAAALASAYQLCIDGIFGFQYRAPLPDAAVAAIAASAQLSIGFRVAVDLPSGLSSPGAFRADFTYSTGSVKAPILACANAGRPRFLDLGFFDGQPDRPTAERVISRGVLSGLKGFRTASSDKRSQGHLALVGGSVTYPGAILMATLAALRSGVGLVTSFVPERFVSAFAAQAPEAMWVGMPETAEGGLSLQGLARFIRFSERATAVTLGPGLGRDPESLALALSIVRTAAVPLVIDADALQPDIVRAGSARRVLTPHAGEFARISEGLTLRQLAQSLPAVVISKGPLTRVCGGDTVYHAFSGGPVLSRGGSGDLLAGLTGGLVAQAPGEPLDAACRAALWHGTAADLLARKSGQTAVHTLQLLEFLAPALLDQPECQPN